MSFCTSCYNAEPIPRCIEQLIIAGTTLPDDTAVLIYYEQQSTGRIDFFAGTVVAGFIVADQEVKFPTGTPILIWVINAAVLSGQAVGNQQNQYEKLIINLIQYTCIETSVIPKSPAVNVYDLSLVEP